MIDLRRREIRTDSATLGLVLMLMGWYASPWQPIDTLFTRVLASQGLETTWALALMIVGGLKVWISVAVNVPIRIESSWQSITSGTNIAIAMICWWTFLQFIEQGLMTPTVLAMGVIGAGSMATLIRDAIKKKSLRCRHGRQSSHG